MNTPCKAGLARRSGRISELRNFAVLSIVVFHAFALDAEEWGTLIGYVDWVLHLEWVPALSKPGWGKESQVSKSARPGAPKVKVPTLTSKSKKKTRSGGDPRYRAFLR